jgi:hypothetical protein
VEQWYRIVSKVERFGSETASYTFVCKDGALIRANLPVRHSWEVGDVVKVEEAIMLLNQIEDRPEG